MHILMAQPRPSNPAMQSTASRHNSNTPLPGPSLDSQDSIQTIPAANPPNPLMMNGEDLPQAVRLMIEKEVEQRAEELRRAGYLWTDMPFYEKAWSIVSNCILLATFATTIWLGISQRRADQASIEANKIAEQSVQVAADSETTAIEALSQASASNNISATNNDNAAYQEWLTIEEYCEATPWSNITFTNATGKYNCSQIRNTSIDLPHTCVDGGEGFVNCIGSSPETESGPSVGGLVGIAVGITLGVIIALASICFCWRRRRTNKRILGSSGTTEIQGTEHALGPNQDLEKHFVT